MITHNRLIYFLTYKFFYYRLCAGTYDSRCKMFNNDTFFIACAALSSLDTVHDTVLYSFIAEASLED